MVARLSSIFCVVMLLLSNFSLAGAALSQAKEPESYRAPVTTITIWHSYSVAEQAALADVITSFEAASPTIQVDAQFVNFADLRDTYIIATQGGSGPNLLLGPADWGPIFIKDDLIQDLYPLVPAGLLSNFLPNILETAQYRGKLLGLPHSSKGVVLFRNTSIITNAVSTYAELVTAAQAATQGDVKGAHLERGFFFGAGHLFGLGGRVMDGAGCPAFNTAEGVAWLQLMDTFEQAGPTEYYTDADIDAFKAGQAGFVIDGTWNLDNLRDAVGANHLAIDPWPTPLSGYVQSELIYLSSNATGQFRDAGLAFMTYLLSLEVQENMMAVGHVPAISGVMITDLHLQQAVNAFAGGVSFPNLPQLQAYWQHMDTSMQAVFDLSADPALALQQAHDRISDDLEAMGYFCEGRVFLPMLAQGVLLAR